MRVAIYTNRYSKGIHTVGAKNLLLDSILPSPDHTDADLQRAMIAACVSPMSPLDKLITQYSENQHTHRRAIKYFRDSGVTGSAWHHGDSYFVAIKGTSQDVLEHCSLSQTSREQLFLEAARRSTHGREVVAVASGYTSTLPGSLSQTRGHEFIGFLLTKPAQN